MFAYLVAGVIVGGLVRFLRHREGDPSVNILLSIGGVAGGLAGLLVNVLRDEDFLAVDAWGFTAAAIAALVGVVFVQARTRRGRTGQPVDG